MLLIRRLDSFDARELLLSLDASSVGVSRALAGAFGGDTKGADRARSELREAAYPSLDVTEEAEQQAHENLAAQDTD